MSLVDVQGLEDERHVPLHRVGVSQLKYPIFWEDGQSRQSCLGVFALGVKINEQQRGAHLSRFIHILQKSHESPGGLTLSLPTFHELHHKVLSELEAAEAVVECEFSCFRTQIAPSSGQPSLSYDTLKLRCDGPLGADLVLSIGVTVTSLCPCSKEISQYGAHNQRSLVEVQLQLPSKNESSDLTLNVEQLCRDIAAEGSCEIYNLLKRPDEKAVTERAYENPKFSEDVVRDIVLMLGKKYASLKVLQISSTHLESIHQHDAFSIYQGV